MNPDLLVIDPPHRLRSLLPHGIWLVVIVAGAVATFDRPTALQFWGMGLAIWVPLFVFASYRLHRSVVLDRARREVIIRGRSLLFRPRIRCYDVATLTGVRSFVDRRDGKQPRTNRLELVSPEAQRGMFVMARVTRSHGVEHPDVARMRALLAAETWLNDLGYVGKSVRMPHRVTGRAGAARPPVVER